MSNVTVTVRLCVVIIILVRCYDIRRNDDMLVRRDHVHLVYTPRHNLAHNPRRDPVYNRLYTCNQDRSRRTYLVGSCEYSMIIAHISARCKYDTWCLVRDCCMYIWYLAENYDVLCTSRRESRKGLVEFYEDLVAFLWGGAWQIALLMLRSLYSQELKGFITRTRDLYEIFIRY